MLNDSVPAPSKAQGRRDRLSPEERHGTIRQKTPEQVVIQSASDSLFHRLIISRHYPRHHRHHHHGTPKKPMLRAHSLDPTESSTIQLRTSLFVAPGASRSKGGAQQSACARGKLGRRRS
mmetsp:Transcript_25089/g.73293  ORF Transcript_25089/g.73293 Transcript_25089/m.73293 type:complete len:120 (+) Transcript_25089:893-1252(+)